LSNANFKRTDDEGYRPDRITQALKVIKGKYAQNCMPINPDSYKPERVPTAFKALQKPNSEVLTMMENATITIVERPEMYAMVLRTIRDGRTVREAWKKIEEVMANHPDRSDTEFGLVFIPEWQWPTTVETLWVGVEVKSLNRVPQGFETLTLPARKFAKTTVYGNREDMNRTYDALWTWFQEGDNERDMTDGSYGYEVNRLSPINPFHVPAETIDHFDFDIYAPIKDKHIKD
jgi:predicted transcriptional regulator YdeE